MTSFHGDLLVGGLRLREVQGELDRQSPLPNSSDWQLSGQMHMPANEVEHLQVDRVYRLQLHDGRAGQVVVSDIVPEDAARQRVIFHACSTSRPHRT